MESINQLIFRYFNVKYNLDEIRNDLAVYYFLKPTETAADALRLADQFRAYYPKDFTRTKISVI